MTSLLSEGGHLQVLSRAWFNLTLVLRRDSQSKGRSKGWGAGRQVTPLAWIVSSTFSHVLCVTGSISYYSQPRILSCFPISPPLSNILPLDTHPKAWPPKCGPWISSINLTWRRSLKHDLSLIWVRDCGGVGHNGSSGDREKSDSRSPLKVELTGFPDQLCRGL